MVTFPKDHRAVREIVNIESLHETKFIQLETKCEIYIFSTLWKLNVLYFMTVMVTVGDNISP